MCSGLRRHFLTCLKIDLLIAENCDADVAEDVIAGADYFQRAAKAWFRL